MSLSNISMQSNIQPIKVFQPGSRVKYDVEFLAQIHDYQALNKLRFKLSSTGAMNTSDYIYKYYQSSIVNNTGYGGFRNRDQCWGPVKNAHGRIELLHKPLITEEELKYFDPADESAVEEYGYQSFLNSNEPHELAINLELTHDEEYQIDRPSIITKVDQVINLIDIAKKSPKQMTEKKEAEKIVEKEPTFIPLSVNIFDLFQEATQEDIIAAQADDYIFVDAGPGTGKTYTLIQRINHLVTEQNVDPEGILVLCFTNAAVDEIRVRLREFIKGGADRGLANVDIRTFHSFAWWLIGQANELFVDEGWKQVSLMGQSYESSLKIASSIIKKYSRDIVANWEHFIVDEVQDLTNTLAYFVLHIIHACVENQCGTSIFGDACQAIYDYTQDDSLNSMTSQEFYRALSNQIHSRAKFLRLIKNYRQNEKLISATSDLREAILSQDHKQMESATERMLSVLPQLSLSSITLKSEDLEKYRNGGKICLLLRNNGQTLRVSSNLRKRGISHILNCSATEHNFASWIADVFYNHPSRYISYEEFESKIKGNPILLQHNALEIWDRLCFMLHTDEDELKVNDVLEGIMFSKLSDSICRYQKNGNIIVSNIHRAKGREYETVIIDQDFAHSMQDENAVADEYKTLYVGVTRPRNSLFTAPLQKRGELQMIHIFDTDRRRWGKVKKRQITHLEFNSSYDLNCNDFYDIPQSSFEGVNIDDEISLVRCIKDCQVSYNILHEQTGRIIGKITRSYIDDFMHYMQLGSAEIYELPDRITDLYISGIYTQIVDKAYLQAHPEVSKISPNGVWKWVEIVGVGHAQYGVY